MLDRKARHLFLVRHSLEAANGVDISTLGRSRAHTTGQRILDVIGEERDIITLLSPECRAVQTWEAFKWSFFPSALYVCNFLGNHSEKADLQTAIKKVSRALRKVGAVVVVSHEYALAGLSRHFGEGLFWKSDQVREAPLQGEALCFDFERGHITLLNPLDLP